MVTDLLSEITTVVDAEPETLGAAVGDPGAGWRFLAIAPTLRLHHVKSAAQIRQRAARFQRGMARQLHRGGRGRPSSHRFSRAEDFALLVLYVESLGVKQSTRAVRDYWERHDAPPTKRQIQDAIRKVRGWNIAADLPALVEAVRERWRLNEPLCAPLKTRARRR